MCIWTELPVEGEAGVSLGDEENGEDADDEDDGDVDEDDDTSVDNEDENAGGDGNDEPCVGFNFETGTCKSKSREKIIGIMNSIKWVILIYTDCGLYIW